MKSFRDYLKEGSMKDQMHNDAERMSRQQFCSKYGDEHGEFWDDIMGNIDESNVGGNRSHFIRHNIWTAMDSDEEVLRHAVEGNPFYSAKKFMRNLDDQGYDFTHVISPDGKITYSPQHDPRHLKNFPDEQLDEFDIDTLNQLASHPMAGTLAAAGGAAIGATIGKGITKANDWYQKRKEEKALDRAAGVKEEEVDEGSSENKYSNLSNRGVTRGINRAADDFDRFMDLDQVESPHYKTQHQQDTKKRIQTKPMAGPKGVLPEQGVAEDSHKEQVRRLAAYNEKMAGENPPIELGLREVGNWAKVGHYGDPIKTAWYNIAKYGIRNNKFNDSVDKAMTAIGDFPDKYDLSIPEIDTLYSAYETVYDQWEQSKGQQGMSEGAGKGIMVNGKEVDMTSLEVDGVDSRDYPDFADAYFSAGYFVDGTEMSDEELDQFQQDNGDLLYDKAYDSLHESELNLIKDRAGVKKSDVPAHQRKNSGDPDWKVSHDDLKKERERNISGSEGLAALKKRMGMIEDGTE